MRARWCCHILSALFLLILTACGPTNFFGLSSPPWKKHLSGKTENPPSSSSKRSVTMQPKIHQELEAGNYCSALKLVRKEIKRGLPEAALADEYGQAINGILIKANRYQQEGLPEKAGELLRTAHDGFPKSEAVAKNVTMTTSEISTRIEECAEKLMERGLVAYRSGDLDGAIRTWKMIHTFSPRHQASLKALETAETQLSNLEKVSTQ